ncbi:MAG TPA: hypothetical protein VGB30_10450 [bacterium]
MPGARFLVNISPALALLVSIGIHNVLKSLNAPKKVLAGTLILILMLIDVYYTKEIIRCRFAILPLATEELSWEAPFFKHYLEMGLWLRENAESDDYVALGEAGIIPYVGRVRVIDCFGLIDKYIARLPGKMHYKFDGSYVLSREPEYILLLGSELNGQFVSKYMYSRSIYSRQEFQEDYYLIHRIGDLNLYKRR